ncbi:MAG: site-specific integrase [Spirochaetota bacterium]|nr:site-specific integrase [Spirochaetota bacterium]
MGLYQRENGIFYLQIKINENNKSQYKRISLNTRDIRLAQRMYDNYLLSEINQKLHPTKSTHTELTQSTVKSSSNKKEIKKYSIDKSYTEYLDLCESQKLSKGVIRFKQSLFTHLKKENIKYVCDITQEVINHITKTFKKDYSNKHIRNLKAFLNFCIKKKYYKREDYESLTFLMTKDSTRDIIIEENDYKYMRTAITDKDFLLYIDTLWETGCRPNEITQLKKSNIDFNKGTAKIYQNKTKKYKTVYLTDELLTIFDRIQNNYIFIGCDKNDTHYSRKFKKLKDELELNKEYCLYAFRHSFGTRMLNKTKDIHLVSKLLGHSDISITAKHYINRSDSEIREKLIN